MLSEVARTMRDEDIGAIPIADRDRIVGMVTDRDLVVRAVAEGADTRNLTARDVMSSGVRYCLEEQSVDEVLNQMGDQQLRRLPVLDARTTWSASCRSAMQARRARQRLAMR